MSGPLFDDSAGSSVSSITAQVFVWVEMVMFFCEALKSLTMVSSTFPSASVYPCQNVSATLAFDCSDDELAALEHPDSPIATTVAATATLISFFTEYPLTAPNVNV
jgi:hypothetical protein